MEMIDYIYYTATSTNEIGEVVNIEATYFIPFFDFFMVFCVLVFTILSVWFVNYLIFIKKDIIKVRANLNITKKNLWN